MTVERQHILQRRVRFIVYFTIVYNIGEAIISLAAGAAADSGALVAFGLDSVIEVSSALVVAWQYSRAQPERWERAAARLVACCFFALFVCVSADSIHALWAGRAAEHSPIGIAITLLSLIVMPVVAWWEYQAGKELQSPSVMGDAKQLMVCLSLSVVVLVGLVLNAWCGWWWADPAAALVVAVLGLKEGIEVWREGEICCAPTPATRTGATCQGECSSHGES